MPRHTGSVGFQGGFGDETPQEYYMASRNRFQGGFGDETPQDRCKEERSRLRKENAHLTEIINKFWNPKWETRDPRNYDQAQLKRGIKVEMEHTRHEGLAIEIAMDHLDEFPDYYEMLELMEDLLKQGIPASYVKDAVEVY